MGRKQKYHQFLLLWAGKLVSFIGGGRMENIALAIYPIKAAREPENGTAKASERSVL